MLPNDGNGGAARSAGRHVSLLRESFAGINARFHLAGIYTLVDLLVVITATVLGEDPEWVGLLMLTWVASLGIVFGIFGVVYHAAAGRQGKPVFVHYATFLFLPLAWLHLRLVLVVYAPALLGLWACYGVASPGANLEEWLANFSFWIQPFTMLAILILSLYSMPLCIHDRQQGRRGTPIRDGLRVYRESRAENRRLVALVLVIAALRTFAHFLHGPSSTDLVPSIPEGLLLFASSYLSLVVFFGATRVVLARRPPLPPGASLAGGSSIAGPGAS